MSEERVLAIVFCIALTVVMGSLLGDVLIGGASGIVAYALLSGEVRFGKTK